MKPITDSTLVSEIVEATKPIVIKFEAKWCQLCKAMTPIMLEVEKELGDQLAFYTANVEHCQLITQRYKISQIPGLLAIEGGMVTAIKTGDTSKQEVLGWIKNAFPSLRSK
jgi:thioredoxin 1